MSYTLSFSKQDGWFSVAAQGEIDSFEVFSEKARTVTGEILQSGIKRILLDDRELAISLDAHDITLVAEQLEKANIQALGLRLASLCRPEDRETYRMFETIYGNRSINFRLFTDKQSALNWLLS